MHYKTKILATVAVLLLIFSFVGLVAGAFFSTQGQHDAMVISILGATAAFFAAWIALVYA